MHADYMARFSLTTNMRLLHGGGGEDTTHRDWLLQLGSGLLPSVSALHHHAIKMPEHLCMPNGAQDKEFIAWIFPDVRAHAQLCLTAADPKEHDAWFRNRAILTARNDVALEINTLILVSLDPATEHIAKSMDSVADSESGNSTNFPPEFLNTLTPSGLPPHKLRLRAGAVVIVLRNLDKEKGICNGCRCLVLAISRRLLDVRILTGRSAGKRYLLPRIPFRSGASEFPFILRRRQFPVRLAWAMSIHKAQGQTLKQCGVFLPAPVFTHGQLYVCASRSSSASGLRFWLGDETCDGHGYHGDDVGSAEVVPYTHNVIFPAVLSMIRGVNEKSADQARPVPLSTVQKRHAEQMEGAEYEDLSEGAQSALHSALHRAYIPAPCETGADDEPVDLTADESLNARSCVPEECGLLRRAKKLGLSPSVWAEVSQRSATEIEDFLKTEERRDTPGASSST